MYRRIFAAVALVLGLAACGSSHGATSPVQRPRTAVAVRYAVQPPFVPGARDTGSMLACERALPAVRVPIRADVRETPPPVSRAVPPEVWAAERQAFHLQAVAYDRCTGRNFERRP